MTAVTVRAILEQEPKKAKNRQSHQDLLAWIKGVMETLRKRLFAIHWRLRNFYLDKKCIDFAEFARTCWFGPLDVTGLPMVKGDLGIGGKRLDRASTNLLSQSHSAAQERHHAANWLCDGPQRYSEAETST